MTFIRQTNDTKNYCDGYALVEVGLDGQEIVRPIITKVKQSAGNYCYKLPENEFSQKWLSDRKIRDGYELSYSISIQNQSNGQQSSINKEPKKSEINKLREVLDPKDQELLDSLVNKAIAKLKRKQIETEIAKLQAQLKEYEEAE